MWSCRTPSTQQAEYFPLVDLQGDIIDRLEIAEGLGYSLHLYIGDRGGIVPGLGFDDASGD